MSSSLTTGIVGVAMGATFWGSNFIVLKGYTNLPEDGMNFVFLMAVGILIVGVGTLFASPVEHGDFEVVLSPDGLLGGGMWACGNFLTVGIVKRIGLGLGLAIWAAVNLIVAFIVGIVGLGDLLPAEELNNTFMGVSGVVLATAAVVLFSQVKPTLTESSDDGSRPDELPHDIQNDDNEYPTGQYQQLEGADKNEQQTAATNGLDEEKIGIILAVVAGCFYGVQFVPLSIWNNKVEDEGAIFDHDVDEHHGGGATITAVRFFFSQALGIFLVSSFGFFIYCARLGAEAVLVPPEALLPCVASGMVWSFGCMGGILATAGLGNSVGFVLLLNLSLLVNSAWSVLYFREIEGQRDLRMFYAGCVLSIGSSILISLSK